MLSPEIQIAYLAGLFDGEGCVSLAHNGYSGNNHHIRLLCRVAMCGDYVPKLFQHHFGGHTSSSKRFGRDVCQWMIYGNNALSFLEQVLPYLTVKKPQAELGCEFQRRLIEGNFQQTGRSGMPYLEIVLRQEEFNEMKRLKDESYQMTWKEVISC